MTETNAKALPDISKFKALPGKRLLIDVSDAELDERLRSSFAWPAVQRSIDFLRGLSEKDRRALRDSTPGAPGRPVRCVRDMLAISIQYFRLPTDARKWKAVATQRNLLAMKLAAHADPDGSSITVGTKRMISETGFSRSTLFRRLGELEKLGLLSSDGVLTEEHGTLLRRLNVSKFKAAGVSYSPGAGVSDSGAGVSDSKQESQIESNGAGVSDSAGVPDSGAGVPSNVVHNRSTGLLGLKSLSVGPRGSAKAFDSGEATLAVNLQQQPVVGVVVEEAKALQRKPQPRTELPEWAMKIWCAENRGPLNVTKQQIADFWAVVESHKPELRAVVAWGYFVWEGKDKLYTLDEIENYRAGFDDKTSITIYPVSAFLRNAEMVFHRVDNDKVQARAARDPDGDLYDVTLRHIEECFGHEVFAKKSS